MPRYIDADALKDVIQQHDYPLSDKLNSIGNGMFTLGIFQAIDQMPTISPDDARGVGKWISVEERLPEPYQNVLTCAQKLFGVDRLLVYGIDYTLDNGEWACGGESYKTMVTHWMPLPEPPKEVE